MKRSFVAALLSLTFVLGMSSGCGAKGGDQDRADRSMAEEQSTVSAAEPAQDASKEEEPEAETPEAETAEGENQEKVIPEAQTSAEDGEVYIYTQPADEEQDEQIWKFTIAPDGSCVFEERVIYSENQYNTQTTYGTGYVEDGQLFFNYQDKDRSQFNMSFVCPIAEDHVLTEVRPITEESLETAAIAGTYTSWSSIEGDLKLTVNEDGSAELVRDNGHVLNGHIFIYQEAGEWDLMCSSEDGEESVDWIVWFDGGTFTFEDFRASIFRDYEGVYQLIGDLGPAKLTVDRLGEASGEFMVDGRKQFFYGTIYVDQSEGVLTGCFLKSPDEGLELNLDLNFMSEEDGWNYYGKISRVLGAG